MAGFANEEMDFSCSKYDVLDAPSSDTLARTTVCIFCKIVIVQFFQNLLCNMYVTLYMPMVPVWVFGSDFFVGCEHTSFCVEIVKHHL